MPTERDLARILKRKIADILPSSMVVLEGEPLLHHIFVDNRLGYVPAKPGDPKRGQGAFQTDLCIFETIEGDIKIPRVVIELKVRLTTHDVLTYSAKARKHKQIYPYLRYGLVICGDKYIHKKVFLHNEAVDFCIAAESVRHVTDILMKVVPKELKTSRCLEDIEFDRRQAQLFRTEIILEPRPAAKDRMAKARAARGTGSKAAPTTASLRAMSTEELLALRANTPRPLLKFHRAIREALRAGGYKISEHR